VIAVISVLIALLMPAVQQAREAARRTQCRNNLKQIGLALHNYHNTHQMFPPVLVTDWTPSARTGFYPGWWSWYTRILPHIEQTPLYNQIDMTDDFVITISDYREQISKNIPIYLCPSDPNGEKVWSTDDWWQGPVAAAHTSYLGCRGSERITPIPGGLQGNGLFPATNVGVRLSDITDGASHTLHVGERPTDNAGEWGWWAAGTGFDLHGLADHVMDCSEGLRPGDPNSSADLTHFWSMHRGGAFFLMCDGSVHFLSESINHDTFLALGSRTGNEVTSPY
jgi:type II secretory pathway pseudopilin PulG